MIVQGYDPDLLAQTEYANVTKSQYWLKLYEMHGKSAFTNYRSKPKPIEGNSFDFTVSKVPEGYALAEMQWISKDNLIENSFQEAVEHGATGEDGFYISGDGQFSGL